MSDSGENRRHRYVAVCDDGDWTSGGEPQVIDGILDAWTEHSEASGHGQVHLWLSPAERRAPACGNTNPHLPHNGFATSNPEPWCPGVAVVSGRNATPVDNDPANCENDQETDDERTKDA